MTIKVNKIVFNFLSSYYIQDKDDYWWNETTSLSPSAEYMRCRAACTVLSTSCCLVTSRGLISTKSTACSFQSSRFYFIFNINDIYF